MKKQIRWLKPVIHFNTVEATGPWGCYMIRRESPGSSNFVVALNGSLVNGVKGRQQEVRNIIEAKIRKKYPEYQQFPKNGE